MQSSQIDPALAAVNARQKAKFAASVGASYPKQVLLRDILNTRGLTGPTAFKYEAYAAELFGVARRFAGPARVAAAGHLVDKYLALGLAVDPLTDIAEALYGVDVPPGITTLSSPPNGAAGIAIAGNLTWLAASRASGYDVYLYKTVDPAARVSVDQPGLIYAYVGLTNLTNYTWSVHSQNEAGYGPMSALWTFTTV
jgi:hypothetical protein